MMKVAKPFSYCTSTNSVVNMLLCCSMVVCTICLDTSPKLSDLMNDVAAKLSAREWKTFGACCVLHNICQTLGDTFDEHWLESSQEPQDSLPALATPPVVTSTDASNIRRAIMLHFSNK